ncbi:MAG: GMC family oxidoreductase [Elusimicrobia bacterium]|nr:GMC family oxidoreductase [Elusimicrobiota bacterium]
MSSHPTNQTVDVCVVGTGAGGGLLIYELVRRGLSVLALEQGAAINDDYFTNRSSPDQEGRMGIDDNMPWPLEPLTAFIYNNRRAGRLYADQADQSTSGKTSADFMNRQIFRLNGKQNLWNGVSLRHSRRDFQGKDCGDSDINWPIDYSDVEPHYSEVEKLIGVCGTREGLDVVPDGEFLPPMPLRPADHLMCRAVRSYKDRRIQAIPMRKAVETRPDRPNACEGCGVCFYGCRSGSLYKFSSHLLPRLIGNRRFNLLCQTKVVRLRRNSLTHRIEAVECLDLGSGERFEVKAHMVVLAAGALETPRILFNSKDQAFPNGLANGSGLLGKYLQDNVTVSVTGTLWKMWGQKFPKFEGFGDHLLIPRFQFNNGEFRGGYQIQFVQAILRRPTYVAGMGFLPSWLKEPMAKLMFNSYAALHMEGKPESLRVNQAVPSAELDVHGLPKVDVHYTFSGNDRRMQDHMVRFGKGLMRRCSGIFVESRVFGPGHSIHYAGTCRMAARAEEGVVDRDLCSFDHRNLFVCDASVLPELSEKNCSLTVMALAHRLAGKLERPKGSW